VRRRAHRSDRLRRCWFEIAMSGKKRREMCPARDGTDAWSAAAVRNAKGLVQIEVRNIGAEAARRCQTDQRIQIRAVDIHLAAVLMHDGADAVDSGFENAVRRWIRHHD